jgi:hypothetical protein
MSIFHSPFIPSIVSYADFAKAEKVMLTLYILVPKITLASPFGQLIVFSPSHPACGVNCQAGILLD